MNRLALIERRTDAGTTQLEAPDLTADDQRILSLERLAKRTAARLEPTLAKQRLEIGRAVGWIGSIAQDRDRYPVVDGRLIVRSAPQAIRTLVERHRRNPAVREARAALLETRATMPAASQSRSQPVAAKVSAPAPTGPAPDLPVQSDTRAPAPVGALDEQTAAASAERERLHLELCAMLPRPDEVENLIVRNFLYDLRADATDMALMKTAVEVAADPAAADDVMRHGAAMAAEFHRWERMAQAAQISAVSRQDVDRGWSR